MSKRLIKQIKNWPMLWKKLEKLKLKIMHIQPK